MTSTSFSRTARASLAAALLGAVCLVALPALAQEEEVCAPPTVVDQPPPPLPEYDQPPLPAPGYIWSPGYWAWDADETDYYWVPGTWIQPPRPGLLWTPGYWAWVAGAYVFHGGYWGPHVGFYGGINYGFGYTGEGYEGGRWDHGAFFYNRSVNNFGSVAVRNVYEKNVVINENNIHVSFNGGKGGAEATPTAEDRTYARQPHFVPTPQQRQHVETASKDPALFQKTNHGAPAIAATPRPAEFKGPGVAPARAAGTPPGAPANGASPAELNRPGGEERKQEEKKPAGAGRPDSEQKRPPAAAEPQSSAKPTQPAAQGRPPVEEKRQVPEERKPAEGNRPAAEEKHPEPPLPQPQAKPEEPAKPEREVRPEPPKPQPQETRPEPPKPQPQQARPEPPRPQPQAQPPRPQAPANAHPPGKPEEKRQP